MKLLNKVRELGLHGVFVRVNLLLIQNVRKFIYSLVSNNRNVTFRGKCYQPVIFLGRGEIEIGKASFGVWPSPYFLTSTTHIEARNKTASILIGNNVHINNNAVIIADKSSITIGDDCLIGTNFSVFDSDFHSLNKLFRSSSEYVCASVTIGRNVFIGNDVTILKNVAIGDNAVIGSGTIVTKDVPSSVVVAGNPARIIRNIS